MPARPLSLPRRLAFAAAATLGALLLAEAVASAAWAAGWLEPPVFWVLEAPDDRPTFRPDATRGAWIVDRPARLAVVDGRGRVLSQGVVEGNDRGLADPFDVRPRLEACRAGTARCAVVLGDSYSAAQYVPRSWPTLAEESLEGWHVLNASVDGGGLENWHATLQGLVGRQRWPIDAVVYAVFDDDLDRPFASWGPPAPCELGRCVTFGRPAPGVLGTVTPEPVPGWPVLESADFEAVLGGRRLPAHRPLRPWLWTQLTRQKEGGKRTGPVASNAPLTERQVRIVDEAKAALEVLGAQPLVLRVPSEAEVRRKAPPSGQLAAFAERLGAPLLDGVAAFPHANDGWIPGEGHFSAAGSERFAAWAAAQLEALPADP